MLSDVLSEIVLIPSFMKIFILVHNCTRDHTAITGISSAYDFDIRERRYGVG